MIIDENDKTGTWKDKYYYGFLIRPDAVNDPIDLVIKIRDIIESKPDTTARINLAHDLEKGEINSLTPEHIYFVGSWPDPYPAKNSCAKIINPNYRHNIHKFSDTLTWCECGAAKIQTTRSCHANMEVNEHDRACPIYDKQETNAKINRKRASLLRTLARLDFPSSKAIPRFGLQRDSIDTRWARAMDVNLAWERQNGTQLAANTMAHLVYEYSPDKIGQAFDLSGDAVKAKISKYTGVDTYEAYQERRWG